MTSNGEVSSLAILGIGAPGPMPAWRIQDVVRPAARGGGHAEPAGTEPRGAGRETGAEEIREGEVPAAAQPATYTREGRMINVARLRSLPPERLNLLI